MFSFVLGGKQPFILQHNHDNDITDATDAFSSSLAMHQTLTEYCQTSSAAHHVPQHNFAFFVQHDTDACDDSSDASTHSSTHY